MKLDKFLCFMFFVRILTLTLHKTHLFSRGQPIKSFDLWGISEEPTLSLFFSDYNSLGSSCVHNKVRSITD